MDVLEALQMEIFFFFFFLSSSYYLCIDNYYSYS